jgi:hypothetical protein
MRVSYEAMRIGVGQSPRETKEETRETHCVAPAAEPGLHVVMPLAIVRRSVSLKLPDCPLAGNSAVSARVRPSRIVS